MLYSRVYSNAVDIEGAKMSYDPYALAFPAPAFPVTSREFNAGGPLPTWSYQPANQSPELSWGPLPSDARSLVVTAFDAEVNRRRTKIVKPT